jgi:hypothetical protein
MSVVVLGMHRSGTSLVIGLLELHGCYIGEVSSKTSALKPTGTKEHLLVREINNEILEVTNSNWTNPVCPQLINLKTEKKIESVVSELMRHKNWALKDPRMVFTYDIWREYLPPHKTLYCLRDSNDVARSLLKKNQMPLSKGLALWLKYNKKILDLLKKAPGPLIEFKNKKTVHEHFQNACNNLNINFEEHLLSGFYKHNDQVNDQQTIETPQEHKLLYNEITKQANMVTQQ